MMGFRSLIELGRMDGMGRVDHTPRLLRLSEYLRCEKARKGVKKCRRVNILTSYIFQHYIIVGKLLFMCPLSYPLVPDFLPDRRKFFIILFPRTLRIFLLPFFFLFSPIFSPIFLHLHQHLFKGNLEIMLPVKVKLDLWLCSSTQLRFCKVQDTWTAVHLPQCFLVLLGDSWAQRR